MHRIVCHSVGGGVAEVEAVVGAPLPLQPPPLPLPLPLPLPTISPALHRSHRSRQQHHRFRRPVRAAPLVPL